MSAAKILWGQILAVLIIIVASVWSATQWTASQLGFQPELGAPWFRLFDHPVYRPYDLFWWWFSFDAYAPQIFDTGGMIATSGGFVAIVVAIAMSVWRGRENRNANTYGTARWATRDDIRKAGLLADTGVVLGQFQNNYLRHDGAEHVLCFAPTRSGKGVGLVIPTLLTWSGSAIVHDIKGENWDVTAGFRSTFSRTLRFDPTSLESSAYNPLLEVRRGLNEVRDVQNIADILVDPEGSLEKRNHWEKTSHALLVGAILHVLYAGADKSLAGVAASVLITGLLGLQLRNLEVIVDADELLPRDHPFVQVTERVQAVFGNRYTVVIGVTPKSGDVFTPETLGKVLAVTNAMVAMPGVTPGNIQSLAAPRAKDIAGNNEGLQVSRLLDHVPASRAEALTVRDRLAANPQYRDVLVSKDGRTAAIYVEFKKDPRGFGHVMSQVEAAIAPIRDSTTSVEVAGQPVFLGLLETFSKRMGWLLPIAILLIGVIHLEAFRTVQGLVLPLVTAILALVWSLGIMTLAGIHLDPFNNVTPILILAVAAGHAVQMLKRYYEEYDRLRADPAMAAKEANRQAVVNSIIKVGPVMLAACTIASLSFMSLASFDIQAIRTFGIFCGLGIISIAAVELTFTPALRAMLPAPKRREMKAEKAITLWDRFAAALAAQVSTAGARRRVFIVSATAASFLAVGASRVHIDNSLRSFFGANLAERQDDRTLNTALAGTNTFYVLVEGKADDAIKDPAVLRAMEKTQAFLAAQPKIGHTLSVVDMLKQINRGMNGGSAAAGTLPVSAELISQYLLLYSMSGEPGDFDGLVDYPYRNAIIQAFVKTDSSVFVADINRSILPVIKANFPDTVNVRLGGSITTPTAMNEVMVSGKIKNVIQIFLVVFVVASVMFRSARLGGLILIPLGVTLLTVFGVMGFVGIPLQIATSTMAALAIGIGADYAIYLTWRLREELKGGTDEAAAIAATYASAGKAVLFVATAVAGGYAVLMASLGFNVHLWLGLLTSVSMVAAALSTLTLYAALLLTLRPSVIFRPDRAGWVAAPVGERAASAAALGCIVMMAGAALMGSSPVAAQAVPPAGAADAALLMSGSLKATKPKHSLAVGRFVLINPAGQQRVRETTSTTDLKADGVNNRRVTRFNSPADIAGTAVLTVENAGEDDIWVFLPALKKVRRLTASNRRDAFVGTDFSYGDVLGHPVEEWTHRTLRREPIDGVPAIVIESKPRDNSVAAATGYSRRITWLRTADLVPIKTEFYGPQQKLIKIYSASNIRLVDPVRHCFQPMRQVMKNVVTGHTTVIEYSSFKTDVSVADAQFQPRALERAR